MPSLPKLPLSPAARAWLPIRLLLAVGASVGVALLLVLVLYITDLGLSVWDRLQRAPTTFWVIYLLILGVLERGRRVWRPAGAELGPSRRQVPRCCPGQATGRSDPARAVGAQRSGRGASGRYPPRAGGIATAAGGGRDRRGGVRRDQRGQILANLCATAGYRHRGRRARRYHPRGDLPYTWTSSAGDRLILADLPGLNEADGTLDQTARDEALRAHVVVYVCESDLTRDQFEALRTLVELGSPVIVALNKIDRFTERELDLVRERLAERVGERVEVAPVQCGGMEEVTRIYHDGREETTLRERQPRVEELRRALQRYLDTDPQVLDALRDTAVFVLAQQKLDTAVAQHRREKAEGIVQGYSRKAVFGALAAVGPGTDVLIQGYLGFNLLKELCVLYEAPAREVDMQRFLDLAGNQIKRSLNLLLALVGNVFKAFPGMGTVVGGMMHAVVYGLIFESLGKAVARSLESRGDLVSGPALRMFEDNLSEDLEARAKRLAQLVWTRQRDGEGAGSATG
ncbi:MAG: hypothetical protein MZV65_01605 [Chromatiales bacterium]|nr:hypothetical protein [Chromatiales bacterium]